MEIKYQKDYKKSSVVLSSDPELDLDAYPVRMLQYHTAESLLPCSLQCMDNQTEFCYDITAKESLREHLQHQKVKAADLREILEGFMRMLSDTEMFLLDADQILLQPELIFYNREKNCLQFCWFPGDPQEIYLQFRNLMEYLLPLLDHGDAEAVRIGYGIYRTSMEAGFHVEHIKEQLYREQEEREIRQEQIQEESEETAEPTEHRQERAQAMHSFFEVSDEEIQADAEKSQGEKSGKTSGSMFLLAVLWAAALLGVCVLRCLGYLTFLTFPILLGGFLVVLALLFINGFFSRKRKNKGKEKEQTEGKGFKQNAMAQASIQWPGKKVVEPEEIQHFYSQKQQPEENPPLWGSEDHRETSDLQQGNLEDTQPLPTQLHSVVRLRSQSPDKRPDLTLPRDWAMIGKNADMADVVINWPTISRIHAKFCKVEQDFYLTDLNSMNGTWINGTAISGQGSCKVEVGDVIRFADAEYILEV